MDVKPDVAMLFSLEVSHDYIVTMETKMANNLALTFLKALTKTILSRNAVDKQFQVQSILISIEWTNIKSRQYRTGLVQIHEIRLNLMETRTVNPT